MQLIDVNWFKIV